MRLGFLCLLFCFGVTACKTAAPDSVLRIQIVSDPLSLDPAYLAEGVGLRVLNNMMEGLVRYDGSGELKNALAETYTLSPDGKQYFFKLRSNARWSDGKPVQVSDFVFALRRVLDPQTAAPDAPQLYPIRGAKEFNQKKAPAEVLGIREERGGLIIELKDPAPYFIKALANPIAMPMRADLLDPKTGKWIETGASTGPYHLTQRDLDNKLILERNKYYYGEHDPRGFSSVEFKVVADESAAVTLFTDGRLDILTRVPPFDIDRLKKMGVILTTPFFATFYISFNFEKPPFNNKQWRRAIAGAIHRAEISQLLRTGDLPAQGMIPGGLEGYVPYDPRSRVFSDSVAWAKKQKKISVPLTYNSTQFNDLIFQKVQRDVQKELGIRLTLDIVDWKSLLRQISTDPPLIYRYGWQTPIADPLPILFAFKSGKWNSARYDQLVSEIEHLASGPKRESKIKEAQKILVEDEAAVVPFYHYVQNTGVGPRVENVRVNPFAVILVNEIRRK